MGVNQTTFYQYSHYSPLELLHLITCFNRDNMVKTLVIATAVLALAMMIHASPIEMDPQEIGDTCEPHPSDEWKCSLIGSGNNFCNFKTKRCEKYYNGCSLGSLEIACISVKTAESIAVLICESQCETTSCKDLCKKISKIAEEKTCITPKQFMCNLDNCPQNWQNPTCKGVAVAGK